MLVVKAEHRTSIPGIVHGASTSGASLFLEPLSTVEINNDIVAVEQQEQEEVYRILLALTHAFRERGGDLAESLDAATALDVVQARARYSQSIDGVAPALVERGLELLAARHPLLKNPVPVTIRITPPASTLEKWVEATPAGFVFALKAHQRITHIRRLKDAGARVILGSHTGLPDHFFGYAEQRELELMHSAGMTTMEVIVAATSRGAEYLQLPDRGTLAPGKRADFLVLDANPLDDIRNTRRIARTFINGAEIHRAALRSSLIK